MVLVINFIRIKAIKIKPNKSMRTMPDPIYANNPISMTINTTSHSAF
jgi:hypothetical protein